MKVEPKAALHRMGTLNNAMVDLINRSPCTPAETLLVLRLQAYRIERSFEIQVTPRRLPVAPKKEK